MPHDIEATQYAIPGYFLSHRGTPKISNGRTRPIHTLVGD